jgi:hypothetical protein
MLIHMFPEASFNAQEQYEYDRNRWLCCVKVWSWGPPRGVLATTRFHHGEFGGQNETMWFWAKRGLTGTEEKGQLSAARIILDLR